jgi:hypothetical protein
LKQQPKLCESMKTKKGLSSKPKTTKPKAKKIDPEQERREKVEKICELYSLENVTIESCCSEIGISVRTFQNWINNNSEYSDKYKKAKEANAKIGKDGIREKAATALEKAITGFFVEEEETIERFNAGGVKTSTIRTKRKKFINPSTTAIIFALKNVDPANWNDQNAIDISGEEQIFKIGEQIIKFK